MRYILCYIFFFLFPVQVFAEVHVGYRSFSTWNSRENVRLDVGVWYPTESQERDYVMDEYRVFVARNAPIQKIIDEDIATPFLKKQEQIRNEAKKNKLSDKELQKQLSEVKIPYKKYPLLVLSHASGATRFSYHTLVDLLVKQGYIVAVPNHNEDNSHDMRSFYSAKSLYQRARQCSLAVDLLLLDNSIASYIDSSKISFLGFDSGGVAGLLLAGGELTVDRWADYCKDYPKKESEVNGDDRQNLWIFDIKDNEENVLCKEPIRTLLENFALGLKRTEEMNYMENLFFHNALEAKNALRKNVHELYQAQIRWSKRRKPGLASYIYEPPFVTPFLPPLPTQYTYIDTRFKHFIFVSPGFSMFFDLSAVKKQNLSFCFVGLENDYFNKPQFQAQVFFEDFDKNNAKYYIISGADLWAAQAPCFGSNVLVEICKSVSEEQREKVLEELFNIVRKNLPVFK